jgi:signal transduction histidine kinase/putative methionine-R-sulfoxide reductase with GAF domain
VLAKEQAALRRLATLVAGGAPPEEVFAAVTEAVGRLLAVDYAALSRYESDRTLTYLAAWTGTGKPFPPVGTRVIIGGNNVSSLVFETRRPARIDSYADASGPLAVAIREAGVRSAVGTPIIVEGRVWGVIGVGSVFELPLPGDTEARLASFTELVAAAIASAESRVGFARLAEEQAALRRLATLVARGVPPEEVFAAVTEEVVRVLPVEVARMGRYEPDGTVTFVAASGMAGALFPPGARLKLGGKNVSTLVAQTGRPARIDTYAHSTRTIGMAVRGGDLRLAVGTPVIVEGRVWGVMVVGSTLKEPLPADTEARLAQFTELMATAVANAESRAGLARLGEEQAALRRVATLVAQGVPRDELFAAVAEEVVNVLPVQGARIGRYESDRTVTYVATTTEPAAGPAAARLILGGKHFALGGKNLATVVFETGGPARLDNFDDVSGPIGVAVREVGGGSAVGTPIVVDGRLWGVVSAGSTLERPLPPDTEARLTDFTELLATAIANAESRADLAASRARIVAAADETRRRIERDLHDGAQQRLVHTVILQQLALRALKNGDANVAELMAEALQHAEQANAELSDLAHGVLPSVLTREGLHAAVNALVSRVSLPVSLDVSVGRLPAGIEATAYFVVSEALTNVVKHAHASGATVTAWVEHGELRVEIRDDGIGGAQSGESTGLRGLDDRVSALDGRLVVESAPEQGTVVSAFLPVSDQG